MKTDGPQIIPAEYLEKYQAALTEQMPDKTVRKRYPFRNPHMQSWATGPSEAQRYVREIFKRCVDCYNAQTLSGGAEPPAWGPRDRSWWFNAAGGSGLWYFDYFMQQTLDEYFGGDVPIWCKEVLWNDTHVESNHPDTSYGNSDVIESSVVGETEKRVYFKNPYPDLPYINLDTGAVLHPGLPYPYWTKFKIWKVDDTWTPNTLTWNNQPELDTLLSIQNFRLITGHYKMWVGKDVSAFCITRLSGAYGYRWFSAQSYAEYRPFMST